MEPLRGGTAPTTPGLTHMAIAIVLQESHSSIRSMTSPPLPSKRSGHGWRWGWAIALGIPLTTAILLLTQPAFLAELDNLRYEAFNSLDPKFRYPFPESLKGDRSGQLSPDEIRIHRAQLQKFLGKAISITDSNHQQGRLTVQSLEQATLPPTIQAAPNTHTTLRLNFDWSRPIQGLTARYNLFLPGVATSSCLTTILQGGRFQTFVFTPTRQTLSLMPGLPGFATGELFLAIAGAVIWGAAHSLSPGHGKTVIGAYLIGERATPRHALLLALITTVTHTVGVFALGLITLFAARYILPEQLYPWLSLISGGVVAVIGIRLLFTRLSRKFSKTHPPFAHSPHHPHTAFFKRMRYKVFVERSAARRAQQKLWFYPSAKRCIHESTATYPQARSSTTLFSAVSHQPHRVNHGHEHGHHTHTHDHDHDREPHHRHHARYDSHSHDDNHGHYHSHLPSGADGTPITWRSLVALGVSGGLIPCPAALVLLLGAIALNQVAFGLALVLAFSLGLAGVLTGLGLLMVYSKDVFRRVPTQFRFMKGMPVFSAIAITLIGVGVTTKAIMQIAQI